jgi:hypothetical protein
MPDRIPDIKHGDRARLRDLLRPSAVREQADYVDLAQLSERVAAYEAQSATEWTDRQRAELDTLLAEYNSLRQESLNTINNRVQVLLLGLAAVGALAGGAMTSEGIAQRPELVTVVFSAAIPLLSSFVFLSWLSEAVRSHRAGYFLASWLEPRINALFGRLVLSFEASLWTRLLPRDELGGPSMMALVALGAVAAGAPVLGLYVSHVPFSYWGGRAIPSVWIPWAGLSAVAIYTLTQLQRLKNKSRLVAAVLEKEPDARGAQAPSSQ